MRRFGVPNRKACDPADPVALRRTLQDAAEALGCGLSGQAQDGLLAFLDELERWNATYNLTAIQGRERMLRQHVIDCLAIVAPIRRVLGDGPLDIVDVGSGGGLPGAVLAIVEPRWAVTCVDAVGKKSAFVRNVAATLKLGNLVSLHSRIEAVTTKADLIVSRAFASLRDFVSLTSRLDETTAVWLAMKGQLPIDEIAELPRSTEMFHVEPLTVPFLDAQRHLVWMRRTSPTSPTQ